MTNMEAIPKFDIKSVIESVIKSSIKFDISTKLTTWIGHKYKIVKEYQFFRLCRVKSSPINTVFS